MNTLRDFMPLEMRECDDTAALKLKDVEVTAEHKFCSKKWPGPQKNVSNWCELVNGKAVGWNENPGRGWSFPVITMPPPTSDAMTKKSPRRFKEKHV